LKFKRGMVAGVFAAALGVGPVFAADYEGAAAYVGSVWTVTWAGNGSRCTSELTSQVAGTAVELTVDGGKYSTGTAVLDVGPPTLIKFFAGQPNGTLTSATIDGSDHLTCDGDRLLLPGSVAPPAPVPTLSEWAMILFGMVLAGGAALYIQRRRLAA
jgi:hypothetical protein